MAAAAAALVREAWVRLLRCRTRVNNLIEQQRQLEKKQEKLQQKLVHLQEIIGVELDQNHHNEEWLKLADKLDQIESALNGDDWLNYCQLSNNVAVSKIKILLENLCL